MRTRMLGCLATITMLGLLAACADGSGSSEPAYLVQVSTLAYSKKAEFTISGSSLDQVGKVTIGKCSGLTLEPSSASSQKVISCTVSGTGAAQVDLKDAADRVLFSQPFAVPEPRVSFSTSLGNMLVELNPTAAPLTVNNFLAYVNSGFYTNTLFHRVMTGSVAQGGWLTSAPAEQTGLREPIVLESTNGLSNLRGSIGMARTTEPNSATSQFFFNLADNLWLNYVSDTRPGYAVFGKVLQGLDVMDAIGAVETGVRYGLSDFPLTDVVVFKVEQVQ